MTRSTACTAHFDQLRKSLSEASPDCLLILTTDHMTNFFYNNNPLFCLGVADTCAGPAPKERARLGVANATLKVDTQMARGLLQYGIENDIDFAYSEEMILDHAYMVPLNFITPKMDLPIVPLHIGSLLPPCPTSRRCYQIGKQIAAYVEQQYDGRVAVLASDSLFSDVGGPTMGWVDTPFDMEFLGHRSKIFENAFEIVLTAQRCGLSIFPFLRIVRLPKKNRHHANC